MAGWFKKQFSSHASLAGLVIAVLAAAFFYAFMEWLFMVTKPSYMDALLFPRKAEILVFTGALISALLLIALAPALLVAAWLRRAKPALGASLIHLLYLAPAAVLAAVLLLWLDNFTYTVFEYGIVSTQGVMRGVYALAFLVFIGVGWRLARWVGHRFERIPGRSRVKARLPYGLALAIGVVVALPLLRGGTTSDVLAAGTASNGQRPNIFLITSDGLNASNMSAYGYERETTPNIRALAETALVAENNFTNSGNTSGSVSSIYTGKYPSTTRVMYPPDILRGLDSYQHLPGILRSLGYRTVQITYPHFIDAYTLNLLNGFDLANYRTMESVYYKALNRYLPHDFAYFLYETSNRIFDRLRHIFWIKQMENPFNLLNIPADQFSKREKLQQMLTEIRRSSQPLFVHIHFMGTHGAWFTPDEQVFSQGKEFEAWDVNSYDDAILEFDRYVGAVEAELRATGQYDDSILVIGSDHGQRFTTTDRIPLIIHFPSGQHAGRIRANAQNLDIAPTLLDFLDVPVPDWMQGASLLQGEPDQRPIFGFLTHKYSDGRLIDEQIKPPFYQFDSISTVYCNRWYRLNLETRAMDSGEVTGYTSACVEADALSAEEVLERMIAHLAESGFETRALQDVQLPPVAAQD
ncbi:MAG TPA: sulfatase [Anaerolineaceae bacterium]|nr:sulfatase [Anaerolineaceae bacterium]